MNKDILVVLEIVENQLSENSLQLVSKALELKDELDSKLYLLLMGHELDEVKDSALHLGADFVLAIDDENLANYRTLTFARVLENVLDKYEFFAVMLPASENMRDLAGRITARKSIGLVADCIDVVLDEDKEDIAWIRPTFDGQFYSDVRCTTKPLMATVGDGVFQIAKPVDIESELIDLDIKFEDTDLLLEVLKSFKSKKTPELSDAKIIVSGGLGLREPKNWHIITELADALGAQVSGSKPIADQLWIPQDRFVGMSGQKVHPKLYIAVGISGAMQHIQGMKDSDLIIAINNDPSAPIFEVAHYKVVADLFEFVPKLTEKLRGEE